MRCWAAKSRFDSHQIEDVIGSNQNEVSHFRKSLSMQQNLVIAQLSFKAPVVNLKNKSKENKKMTLPWVPFMHVHAQSLSNAPLFCDTMDCKPPAPPSMGFSRQEYWFSSVQSLSHVQFLATSWTAACQASLPITNSWSLLRFMSIALVIPSNHLMLCCPLLLLPSISPSIRVFSNELALHIRWPEYWSFSFSISLSSEYLAPISLRMDRLDLLAVQGTLKGLQHHSSKTSILWHSAFFIVQLSHPCMPTGKP